MARVLIIGSLEAELGQAARIAVARGARHALIVGDMPFLSYGVSQEESVEHAGRFLSDQLHQLSEADLLAVELGYWQISDSEREI
jgi:ketopantoate hydroxymethyltransferase